MCNCNSDIMQTTAKAKYIKPFNRQIKQIDTSMYPPLSMAINGEVQTQVLEEVDLGIIQNSSTSNSQNQTLKQKFQSFWTKTKTYTTTLLKNPVTYVLIVVIAGIIYLLTKKRY